MIGLSIKPSGTMRSSLPKDTKEPDRYERYDLNGVAKTAMTKHSSAIMVR
jgi:hypothetical protein